MRTHVMADDGVRLTFSPQEHLALSHTLYYLITDQDPIDGIAADELFPFVYAVFAAETEAQRDGLSWLQGEPSHERDGGPDIPGFGVVLTEQGSEWRVTLDQLWFLEACASEMARRAE